MADKPSRGLVVYGDGLAPLVGGIHSNLHSLASLSSCGFLSLRDLPDPDPQEISENKGCRGDREFAQLVDAYDYYTLLKDENGGINDDMESKKPISIQSLSERFMGLRAAIVTGSSSIRSFAGDVGFTVLEMDDLIKKGNTGNLGKKADDGLSIACGLLNLLGFSQGKVLEQSEFDLVFFHIKADEQVKIFKDKIVIRTNVDWIDNFVGEVMQIAHPGSDVASRLLFSLILSYGTILEKDLTSPHVSFSQTISNSDLSLLRPCQSYATKGGVLLDNMRHHHPMLLVQWQDSVTRRDLVQELTFKEFKDHGGNLAILSDRFLHEVAFKLWKAPKYGA